MNNKPFVVEVAFYDADDLYVTTVSVTIDNPKKYTKQAFDKAKHLVKKGQYAKNIFGNSGLRSYSMTITNRSWKDKRLKVIG